MKKRLDYIHPHPQRTQSILGICFKDFQQLNEQVKQAHAQNQAQKEAQKVRVNARGAGRPEKLRLCETMELCLFYLRHDPTFEVLAIMFEVSKSEAHETFHEGLKLLRQVLPASVFEEFGADPYLWLVVQELLQEDVLLTDSTEQAREADVNLLRQQQERLDPNQQFMGDKAYQGAGRTTTPHKKPRNQELTETQRTENQVISGQRIFIEHLIRRLKIFRILTHRFRLSSQGYASVRLAVCGLVRLRLGRLDFTVYGP